MVVRGITKFLFIPLTIIPLTKFPMAVETNKLRSTREILDATVAALKVIALPQGQPAFDRVEHFDLPDYLDAMQRLAMNQERTALVIWIDEETETQRSVVLITSKQTQAIRIFISERNLAAPIKALIGDPENYLPGVLGLKDLVKPALVGQILASDPETGKELIYLTHVRSDSMILSAEDKEKFPNRQILIMDFEAHGEWMQVGVESNESIA